VNFIKSLETSDTFFLINSIDVKSGEDEGRDAAKSAGAVSLSLDLETFFFK